ncbi:6-hydroxymethylpterin diphosphokinase MptE-like protein [Clostridium sp.]|uniref:motility associated factor glycosyltransferase family protein n=1 Tax=Clostridium sp. TaxID=1506 RepID=UPI002847A1D3|nr:6-hydroxymethylpterin diphosphokinase MptE-like protein [Clostridium sp.]MDR3594083.1 DUF115 domain-containing protein [Clostridium sp.]
MQKFKTLDDHYVFNIEKDKKHYYLADKNNYKKDIESLLNNVDDIKFDSLIIIFGIDTGEYLDELFNALCRRNRILIFEPNEEIFNYNKDRINKENLKLFLYDKNNIKRILYSVVDSTNFNNLYVHAFGNYAEVYKEEYEVFIENLNIIYFTASSPINIGYRFRDVFLKNLIGNLKAVKDVTPLHALENLNKGIPAIIVSAGPSLDKNLAEMVKYKDEIEKYFIIAGSRTLKALMKNGIKPDMIVSIDPIDDNYDMMKDYLGEDIPFGFYEYSNRYLIRDYKGDKIFLSTVLLKTIKELNTFKEPYLGGSVAHPSIDIANIMGCSPIILVGQDLAFTYDKVHSDSAIFEADEKNNYEANLIIKNVFGDIIKTTPTLNQFRAKLEEYIYYHNKINNVEFINVSYGANIEGAPHEELSDVIKRYKISNTKKNCIINNSIKIDAETIANEVLTYVEECITKANNGEEVCKELLLGKEDKSLIDIEEDDEELQKFLYIMETVNIFESSSKSLYLGGYLYKFLFDIKEEFFNMYAKDYDSLTSNLRYQSKCFLGYFEKMKIFLEEVKSILLETLAEFY